MADNDSVGGVFLRNSRFSLGILEFLGFLGVRGYFLGILDLALGNSSLEILDLVLGILEFRKI